ncbi:MAG: DinB family protein [Maribacter sp.]|uniref:DinB family protein n=1 Tax=Maribacter sp. TaxID=1897614 RepID=UPI003298AB8A
MKSQLEIIIHNLKESFDGKPWYGIPVMEKLNAVPWQIVNDKVYGDKSIAVLVQHIINWRIFVWKKLEGDSVYNIIIDGENDWDNIYINNEEEWNTLKNTLQKTQDKLLQILDKKTDQLLEEQVPGKAYAFGPILTSIAQHDIYHLGQIAMLNSSKQS